MSQLKLGMIGLDTSHCPAFADLLHNEENPYYIPGSRITIAYPGGSANLAVSRDRVDRFTKEMQEKYGVAIAPDIATVAEQSDAIFLESVDGRQHLEQFQQLAPFGKPVFIDKPLTTSTKEARAIFDLAAKYNTPVCSASSVQFATGLLDLAEGKKVLNCTAFGPMGILDDFPAYFWYGIHSAEVLFAKMGVGCKQVSVTYTDDADLITGVWEDGRIGSLFGVRYKGLRSFGATVFTEDGTQHVVAGLEPPYYANMLPRVLDFFRTGRPIVDQALSLETIAFLEAGILARESGKVVKLAL